MDNQSREHKEKAATEYDLVTRVSMSENSINNLNFRMENAENESLRLSSQTINMEERFID